MKLTRLLLAILVLGGCALLAGCGGKQSGTEKPRAQIAVLNR
jgi:hypothetical protein